MPDEEIDKLVRDAASQHHPPYDDKSWGKMEVLLDKHLPQKKDRRRPIIFLLLFLLLSGAVFFAVEQSQRKDTAAVDKNTAEKNTVTTVAASSTAATTPANSSAIAVTDKRLNTSMPVNLQANLLQKNTAQVTNADHGDQQYASAATNTFNQKGRLAIKIKKPGTSDGDNNSEVQKNEVEKNDIEDNNPVTTTAAAKTNGDVTFNNTIPATKKEVVAKADSVNKITTPEKNVTAANNTAVPAKKKTTKSFGDKFAITLSAGADASFIEIDKAGKLKPAYGGGLSYAVGKHITVSSGLYASKKVYTATPYQYKFTGYVNPGLKDIGADCKVLEIPVSVYYKFKQVRNHNWLGGISLSSLLMKRETYDYNYETTGGQTYSYEKTVNNENKHYFSVLTFSGGYQYQLNNRFSLIAEPYIKVPLTGIGLGAIKLNSTGILVTAVIKPFAKKKK